MADSDKSRHLQLDAVLIVHMQMMGSMGMMMMMLAAFLILKQQRAGGGRKRKRSEVVMTQILAAELKGMISAMKSLGESLKLIAYFFAKKRESEEMGNAVFPEILKIDDLSNEEMLRAGESIIKDKSKIAFFLSLPDQEFKGTYILEELGVFLILKIDTQYGNDL